MIDIDVSMDYDSESPVDVGAWRYIGHKEHMERSIDRRWRATEDVDYGKHETFSFFRVSKRRHSLRKRVRRTRKTIYHLVEFLESI